MTHVAFPYRYDGRGRTADAAEDAYVRGLIEQVLFTSPGERVNRPEFGAGLARLVFEPNSGEVAAATRYLVQGNLQRWLGPLVRVEDVQVEATDAQLRVTVVYAHQRSGRRDVARFTRSTGTGGGGGPGGPGGPP